MLLARHTFVSPPQARLAVFDDTQRRHSALGYRSSSTFEREARDAAA